MSLYRLHCKAIYPWSASFSFASRFISQASSIQLDHEQVASRLDSNSYPHTFTANITADKVISQFSHLETGQKNLEVKLSLAGIFALALSWLMVHIKTF
jgi:hypothetical protein